MYGSPIQVLLDIVGAVRVEWMQDRDRYCNWIISFKSVFSFMFQNTMYSARNK